MFRTKVVEREREREREREKETRFLRYLSKIDIYVVSPDDLRTVKMV
jgi:hypothetical protein